MVHEVIKPEVIVATAAIALEENLVVPALFRREGIDQYKGADDDTINVKVEGVLPYRTYGWRNNRSAPIVFDEYKERKVPVSFGGDVYNGVRLTDEQRDFDLEGWSKLAAKQTEAVGRGLEDGAIDYLESAPYEVVITLDEADARASLLKVRSVMNRLRVQGSRQVAIGDDIEAWLLSDDKINLAMNSSESRAESALSEANIGRLYGLNFTTATEIGADDGYALVDSAFIFLTGAPTVPQSVPFGATASHEGVALTWLMDYDTEYRRDRSVVNTYKGFQHVDDPLVGKDDVTGQAFVSESNHFVRAIKLQLGAALSVDFPGLAGSVDDIAKAEELAGITGITPDNATP